MKTPKPRHTFTAAAGMKAIGILGDETGRPGVQIGDVRIVFHNAAAARRLAMLLERVATASEERREGQPQLLNLLARDEKGAGTRRTDRKRPFPA